MKKILTEKKHLVITVAALLLMALLIGLFLSRTPMKQITTYSMGSYVTQTVYGGGADAAMAEAANGVAKLEDEISWRKEKSDIARLNANAGGTWLQIDPTVYKILEISLDVAEKSGGAFDPTIAPLSLLWNFDDSPTEPPPDKLISEHRDKIDYSLLKLDASGSSAVIQKSGYAIDLGATGKGAACDEVVKLYEKQGLKAAIIAVGGSVGTYGTKPDGKEWSIAVRNPSLEGALGSLKLKSGFVSTSGRYEKAFEYEGKTYHHLLDPKTGYPAKSGLVSVTVTSDGGALSDALSTACFVLGMEKSLPLLEKYGAEAIFIDEGKRITVTDGLADKFTLTSEEYTINE